MEYMWTHATYRMYCLGFSLIITNSFYIMCIHIHNPYMYTHTHTRKVKPSVAIYLVMPTQCGTGTPVCYLGTSRHILLVRLSMSQK